MSCKALPIHQVALAVPVVWALAALPIHRALAVPLTWALAGALAEASAMNALGLVRLYGSTGIGHHKCNALRAKVCKLPYHLR